MKKYLIFLLAIFAGSYSVNAQIIAPELCMEVQATTGGSAQVQDMHLAWTMGETMIFTYSPFLTQGFHQPECGYSLVSVLEAFDDFQVQVTPNPTVDFLTISIKSEQPEQEFRIVTRILDFSGKVTAGRQILDYPVDRVIDCRSLTAGLWLLQLEDLNSGKSALFKFFKVE